MGIFFEVTVISSIVTLIVGFTCMIFTENDGIINTIGIVVFVSLLLSGYKSSKEHFLIFEKMLKSHVLNEKTGNEVK